MKCEDLCGQRIVIWGAGREGLAAARLIRAKGVDAAITFVDESNAAHLPEDLAALNLITGAAALEDAVLSSAIVIKSPGVSLYHPTLQRFQAQGGRVTSLLNLWVADNHQTTIVAVTGSKGKSTTCSLLVHVLGALGERAVAVGNIGIPVSDCAAKDYDVCVIEVSSYQAANFDGTCAIGVLTSLFPEHLDWHKTLEAYYRDKCNLLAHCNLAIVEEQASRVAALHGIAVDQALLFNSEATFHVKGHTILRGAEAIGTLANDFLARDHNHGNVCAVLSVIESLHLNVRQALDAMATYQGLPHRQQAVAERDGVLFIDDSISTTPHSAVAAMKAYADRPVTLIAGGQDRGIDYDVLYDYVIAHAVPIVCLGESGRRMHEALSRRAYGGTELVPSMEEAVRAAIAKTPCGGVILLSPASPSYDMYKNYIDRAEHFLRAIQGG